MIIYGVYIASLTVQANLLQAKITCNTTETECNSIDQTSGGDVFDLPGANQCCCSKSRINLLNGVSHNLDGVSYHCTQPRKCVFVCCDRLDKTCGTECCKNNELCGTSPRDFQPCCTTLETIIWPVNSKLATNIQNGLLQNCCPFGLGLDCDRPNMYCCLDVAKNCCVTSPPVKENSRQARYIIAETVLLIAVPCVIYLYIHKLGRLLDFLLN